MNTGFYKENTIESKPWGFRFQWRLHMFKPYEKNIICFSEESWTLASPKKIGSKPERCERVYKRAAKAQRDLFRRGDAAKERAGDFYKKSCRKRHAAYIGGPRKAAGFVEEGGAAA